jgi:putative DNA primase/helicase
MAEIQPDPEVRRVLYELVGYVQIPDNALQTAFMLLGPGANGKSTFINLLRALVGPENVAAIPLHQFDDDRFATAGLYGKLANTFADLDSRALSSSSMFKAITGGDAIQAERKFRPAFTFTRTPG